MAAGGHCTLLLLLAPMPPCPPNLLSRAGHSMFTSPVGGTQVPTPSCPCLQYPMAMSGWARPRLASRCFASLRAGQGHFLLCQAQQKCTHPGTRVPLWSCSYLGNVGSGGSGEGFCGGTEDAGEHFLPSRAAGDLQGTEHGHQQGTVPRAGCPRLAPPRGAQLLRQAEEGRGGQGQAELCSASSCTQEPAVCPGGGWHSCRQGSVAGRALQGCVSLSPIPPQGLSVQSSQATPSFICATVPGSRQRGCILLPGAEPRAQPAPAPAAPQPKQARPGAGQGWQGLAPPLAGSTLHAALHGWAGGQG